MRVMLLLNIQRTRGDTTVSDQLVRKFADHFWTTDWPGSVRPNVFYDPRALEMDGPGGVLHAKAVIADDESVFVTSANLTEAALDRNVEVGLLGNMSLFYRAFGPFLRPVKKTEVDPTTSKPLHTFENVADKTFERRRKFRPPDYRPPYDPDNLRGIPDP